MIVSKRNFEHSCGVDTKNRLREAKTYNEAKGKPRVRLDDLAAVVAAVVALADDALVALDFLAEGVLATGEDETHCCGEIEICMKVCVCFAVFGVFFAVCWRSLALGGNRCMLLVAALSQE